MLITPSSIVQAEEIYNVSESDLIKLLEKYKNEGLDTEHFERIKKKIYGDYVVEYNNVADIARMFLADKMKQINSFDYIEEYNSVTKEYTEEILKNVFKTDNMIMSVIKCKTQK